MVSFKSNYGGGSFCMEVANAVGDKAWPIIVIGVTGPDMDGTVISTGDTWWRGRCCHCHWRYTLEFRFFLWRDRRPRPRRHVKKVSPSLLARYVKKVSPSLLARYVVTWRSSGHSFAVFRAATCRVGIENAE